MAIKLATPGVYIEEKSAFPNSVAAVPTAVPAFIGYTEKTTRNGQSLINKPVRISSLTDFSSIFGEGFSSTFDIQETNDPAYDFEIEGKHYQVLPTGSSRFIFFDAIRLFFANGGSTCYIVSVGAYRSPADSKSELVSPSASAAKDKDGKPKSSSSSSSSAPKVNTISKKALEGGIAALVLEDEPTMLVIPEAIMLEKPDCFALQQAMLMHCGFKMRDRFAILDVYDGHQARSYDEKDVITQFREGVGNNNLDFAAAYYPWVYTSIVQNEEVSFRNIADLNKLADILTKEANENTSDPKRKEEIKIEVAKLKKDPPNNLTQTLNVISPVFKNILDKVKMQMNILPPSAGMAGVYSATDNTRGVWKAPANIGFNSVITPTVKLTHEDQEDLNITVTGKSVNAIRTFTGEGPVIWGARTMDGNSQDWRYINVRRTMIFIEQSIKYAAKAYVFEPNTSSTWVLVRSMISSFLNDVWKQGGLVGLTPSDAYEVLVGLGSTMTPNDILDGVMRVSVKVAVSRPAEFIVITFQQKMQES